MSVDQIHSLGTMNVCSKCHGSSSNSCRAISHRTTNVNLMLELEELSHQSHQDTLSGDHECLYIISDGSPSTPVVDWLTQRFNPNSHAASVTKKDLPKQPKLKHSSEDPFLYLSIQYRTPTIKELLTTKLKNKMFCSLVAQLVNLACLIGIARCLEAFQCVTELLLHNRCQMFPLNKLLFFFSFFCGGGYLSPISQVLWDSTRCGEPAIDALFYSTLPTTAPLWDLCLIPHLMLFRHLISAIFQKTHSQFHKQMPHQTYR